jgi:hypothetical protein
MEALQETYPEYTKKEYLKKCMTSVVMYTILNKKTVNRAVTYVLDKQGKNKE